MIFLIEIFILSPIHYSQNLIYTLKDHKTTGKLKNWQEIGGRGKNNRPLTPRQETAISLAFNLDRVQLLTVEISAN